MKIKKNSSYFISLLVLINILVISVIPFGRVINAEGEMPKRVRLQQSLNVAWYGKTTVSGCPLAEYAKLSSTPNPQNCEHTQGVKVSRN